MDNQRTFNPGVCFAVSIALLCAVVFLQGCLKSNDGRRDRGAKKTTSNRASNFSEKRLIELSERSFGVDVKTEVPAELVSRILGKSILKVEDFSNGEAIGAKYFVTENSFVIIDVGHSEAAQKRDSLIAAKKILVSEDILGFDNFITVSEKASGEYIDVYLIVDPARKYVRVGRSAAFICENSTLVKLAKEVETIIKSYQ